jgi:dTMP kinase
VGGAFVTVEGIEGSGKTTLLGGIAERFRAAGMEPVLTREPGGTAVGDALRSILLDATGALDPLTELFVVCAARAEHVARIIAPALAAGRLVLCDRFVDATRAYQGGGRGLDDAVVRACSAYAARGIEPHLTLLVDVPPSVSDARVRARVRDRGGVRDRLEREGEAFHERVRARYIAIAREEPERVKLLDGTLAPGELVASAWAYLAPLADVA